MQGAKKAVAATKTEENQASGANSEEGGGIGTGVVIAIVIGVLVCCVIGVVLVMVIMGKSKSAAPKPQEFNNPVHNNGAYDLSGDNDSSTA